MTTRTANDVPFYVHVHTMSKCCTKGDTCESHPFELIVQTDRASCSQPSFGLHVAAFVSREKQRGQGFTHPTSLWLSSFNVVSRVLVLILV